MAIVACSSDKKSDTETIREQAKKDAIEKFELPEGTQFNDVEVTTNPENGEGPNVEYIVKVTIKSQDQSGKEILKVHKMHYKKKEAAVDAAEAAAAQYELTHFE